MIFMNCPKCGAWLAASEVVAAPGYLQCAVCAYVYPAPVLEPVGRSSKLRRFWKSAVAGAILVGILVPVPKLWTGNRRGCQLSRRCRQAQRHWLLRQQRSHLNRKWVAGQAHTRTETQVSLAAAKKGVR